MKNGKTRNPHYYFGLIKLINFAVLRIEHIALCMWGKCSTTELYPQFGFKWSNYSDTFIHYDVIFGLGTVFNCLYKHK